MKRKNVALGCSGLGLVGALGAGALGLVLVIVLLLVALPWMLTGKIQEQAQQQIDQAVDADVSLGKINVSLLSSFPRLRVAAHDVKVVGRAPFEGVPLADISEVRVGVDLLAALTGQTLTIRSVALVDPKFQVVVNKQGKANYDIVKGSGGSPDGAGSSGPGPSLKLDNVTLQNLDASYDDQKGRIHADVSGLDITLGAELAGNVSHVDAKGTIKAVTAKMGRMTYLRNTRWNVDAKLDYDSSTGGVTFQENKTTVNAFPLILTGSAVPAGKDWNLDLAFSSKDATFASILSLIPNKFKGSIEGLDSGGTLAFDGTAKGRFSSADEVWPGFDVTVGVRDAKFKHPDLPSAVENIDVDLKATHEEGPKDTTEVNVSRFSFAVAGAPFVANAKISHPLTDPVVDAAAKGHLDLATLGAVLPLPEGTEVPTGVVDLDVAFAGAQSDFMAPNPDKIKASGTVAAKNVTYESDALPIPVIVDSMGLTLASDRATIQNLNAHYSGSSGDSDLAMTGQFDNLVGYAMGGETLTGTVALSSKTLDLRPFQGSGGGGGTAKTGKAKGKAKAEPEPSDDEGLLVAVPKNLALNMNADLAHVKTKEVDADDVKGAMAVKDGAITMKDVKATMLGGTATMSGSYVAPTAESADVDLKISTVKFDLGKTVATFSTMKRLVPILEGVAGRFDSGIHVKTKLGRDGSPDLTVLDSDGDIGPSGVKVNPKSMGKTAASLGDAGISTIDLGGTTIRYSIAGGKAKLQPVDLKLGTLPAKLSGTAGLAEETMNLLFSVKVPTKGLDANLIPGLTQVLGAKVDVTIKVTGKWDDPKFSFGLDGKSAGDVVNDLVDTLTGDGKDGKGGKGDKVGDVVNDIVGSLTGDGKDGKNSKAGKNDKAKAKGK